MTLLKHNIQVVVFDLDATFVKTKQLKARSYAQAALTAFKDFVALPYATTLPTAPWNASHAKTKRMPARRHQPGVKLSIAVMSYCEQATRDDVKHGKPNPEMYTLITKEHKVPAGRILVIKDATRGHGCTGS